MNNAKSLLVSSKKMAKLPILKDLFSVSEVLSVKKSWFGKAVSFPEQDVDMAAGWGMKDASVAVRDWSVENDKPFHFIEDGFIGYDTHPALNGKPLSLVIDKEAMHYNCFKPSELESLIASHAEWFDEVEKDIESYIRAFLNSGVSKYNHAPAQLSDELFVNLANGYNNVLVVDQVLGDHSVMYSGGSAERFDQMLEAAIAENPHSTVFVKAHPDTLNGRKKSYLLAKAKKMGGVKIIAEDVAPISLFSFFSKVYTVSSLVGFEALLHNLDVVCFGAPFYSGWGLTDDRRVDVSHRRSAVGVTKAVLFAAAYIKYPTYLDPFTGKQSTFEKTLARLSVNSRKPVLWADTIYVQQFSPWKRGIIKHYLGFVCPNADIVFADFQVDVTRLRSGEVLLVWGSKDNELAEELSLGAQIWCVEDGFLRSIGLGSDLYLPSSLVIDDMGMHFDVYSSSRLEKLIADERFEPFEIDYARDLIEQIKRDKISKYNVGANARVILDKSAHGRRVILVAGQVEGDRSIAFSGAVIRTNYELLKTVRLENPDAYIVYKPHPDILSGNRDAEYNAELFANYYDQRLTDVSMSAAIEVAHEVHVISSQSGFEALMFGKKVHCYGMPFYAGWGLTTDHCFASTWRRSNSGVTVESLFLCAYVIYPTYFDWAEHRGSCCQGLLQSWESVSQPSLVATGGWWRKIKNAIF